MPDDEQGSKKAKKCGVVIRIFNIATGLTLIGFGIAGVIFMIVQQLIALRFFLIFSPIFMILFGVLIIAAQFKVKFILKNLGFLQTLIGRGIFNIYLASSVFYYFSCDNDQAIAGWILAIVLFLMGIIYFFLHCCGGSTYNEEVKEQMM